MRSSICRAAAALTVLFALVACGGGGGGGGAPTPPAPPAPPDLIPDPFSFAERANAVRGTPTTAAPLTVSGINTATAIAIVGGEYSVNGAAFTSAAGTVANGDSVAVRLTAAATPGGTAEASLTIGGVAATFRVTTSDDVTPPTAAVVFPPPVARTGGASITVRGTATDASGPLAAVRVNGVLATTTNGFATWTAAVPLVPGANTLTVSAEDGFLNVASAAAEVAVQRNARLGYSSSIALDAANGRAFVADGSADAIVAVDLATGVRTWFADVAAPGLRRKEALPLAVALDAQRNRLLVLDAFDEAIVAIDLATKQRTLLSGRRTSSADRFQSPSDFVLDAQRNRLLVASSSPPAIIAVDLVSGVRSVVSDATRPDAADLFTQTRAMALDVANHQVLVTDASTSSIYAVHLTTGARRVLSSNTVPNTLEPFDTVLALDVDAANNRALVPQIDGRVLAVDLVSGERTVAAAGPAALQPSYAAIDLAVDGAANRVLLLDPRRGLEALGLASGMRTIVSPNDSPNAGVGLVQPTGMALDLPNGRVFVADEALRAVVAVDLATAVGTLAADGSQGLMQFAAPTALALDAPGKRLFILQSGRAVGFPPAIFVHDLTSNVRTMVSGPAVPNGAQPLTEPYDMALDTLGMRLLVTERQDRHVKAVDLTSGVRTVVSSNTVPDTANPFDAPLGIVVDAAGNRALIASSSLGQGSSVLAMSLATGQRSVVAANNSGLLTGPKALALDAARNRVLVADELWQTLSSADLTSGAIGGLTDLDDPDNPIDLPYALALDPAKQLAYVLEGSFAAVLVVDLVTGRRVFL